jgi:small subunit ribosomal protein S21
MGLRMRVHDREPIGAALRRFKKLVERSGLKRELRAHEYYEKPCEARNRKEAKRRNAIKRAAMGKTAAPKKERSF